MSTNRWPEIRQLFKEIAIIVNPTTSGSPGFYLRMRIGSLPNGELKRIGPLTVKKQFQVNAKMQRISDLLKEHADTCPSPSVQIDIGLNQNGPIEYPVPAAPDPIPEFPLPPWPPVMVPPLPPTTPPSTNDDTWIV